MKSVVVYGSRSGNTRKVAAAIAETLEEYGPVSLVPAEDASATIWRDCELLVVGGPTEGRTVTPPVRAFFDRLPSAALRGIEAAAFDTRLGRHRLLTGSAASGIRRLLVAAGASVVTPPESFLVHDRPQLIHGELERAPLWAHEIVAASEGITLPRAVNHPAVA